MAETRYRCTACGNLTRFDVTTTRTTRAFHHFSVGGVLAVEDEQVLDESVGEVTCRWCGHGRAVEVLADGVPADEHPAHEVPAEPGDGRSEGGTSGTDRPAAVG